MGRVYRRSPPLRARRASRRRSDSRRARASPARASRPPTHADLLGNYCDPGTDPNSNGYEYPAIAGTLTAASTTVETWFQDGTCLQDPSDPQGSPPPSQGGDCLGCHAPTTNNGGSTDVGGGGVFGDVGGMSHAFSRIRQQQTAPQPGLGLGSARRCGMRGKWITAVLVGGLLGVACAGTRGTDLRMAPTVAEPTPSPEEARLAGARAEAEQLRAEIDRLEETEDRADLAPALLLGLAEHAGPTRIVELSQTGPEVRVRGVSRSNQEIAKFMARLEGSPDFAAVSLESIRKLQKDDVEHVVFWIRCDQVLRGRERDAAAAVRIPEPGPDLEARAAEAGAWNAGLRAEAADRLPTSRELPGLLKSVAVLGKKLGLEIQRFEPLPEIPHAIFGTIPVALRVRATFDEIGRFAAGIATLGRPGALVDLRIYDALETDGVVRFTFEATYETYLLSPPGRSEPMRPVWTPATVARSPLDPPRPWPQDSMSGPFVEMDLRPRVAWLVGADVAPTALATLAAKGWRIWYDESTRLYGAEKDGWDLMADTPLELLGAVAIHEQTMPPTWTEDWWRRDGTALEDVPREKPEYESVRPGP